MCVCVYVHACVCVCWHVRTHAFLNYRVVQTLRFSKFQVSRIRQTLGIQVERLAQVGLSHFTLAKLGPSSIEFSHNNKIRKCEHKLSNCLRKAIGSFNVASYKNCTAAAAAAETTAHAPRGFGSGLVAATSLARAARFMAAAGSSSSSPADDYFTEGALSQPRPGESWTQSREQLQKQMRGRWEKNRRWWFTKAGDTGSGRGSQPGWHTEQNKKTKRKQEDRFQNTLAQAAVDPVGIAEVLAASFNRHQEHKRLRQTRLATSAMVRAARAAPQEEDTEEEEEEAQRATSGSARSDGAR